MTKIILDIAAKWPKSSEVDELEARLKVTNCESEVIPSEIIDGLHRVMVITQVLTIKIALWTWVAGLPAISVTHQAVPPRAACATPPPPRRSESVRERHFRQGLRRGSCLVSQRYSVCDRINRIVKKLVSAGWEALRTKGHPRIKSPDRKNILTEPGSPQRTPASA